MSASYPDDCYQKIFRRDPNEPNCEYDYMPEEHALSRVIPGCKWQLDSGCFRTMPYHTLD